MFKLTFVPKSELAYSGTRNDLELEVIKSVHAENVLLLCPHPDDETFGCGALLKHLSSNGSHIKAIYFADGSVGNSEGKASRELISEREEEVFEVLKILGISEVNFLRIPDRKIRFSDGLTLRLFEELKIKHYDLVLVPSSDDWNSDHLAVNLIFQAAYKKLKSKKTKVWQYFVWGFYRPNLLFPADRYINYKREAARCHKSQLKIRPYDETFLCRDQYLGKGFGVSKYAEAYRDTEK